jgi:uncharacterized GH25 family protein
LENAVSCFRFDIQAKALITVGDREKMPEQGVGAPLEIIPHRNPKSVKQGELFPITVLYNGKTLSSANVRATYTGFSEKPNTFALSA